MNYEVGQIVRVIDLIMNTQAIVKIHEVSHNNGVIFIDNGIDEPFPIWARNYYDIEVLDIDEIQFRLMIP